MVKFVCKNCGFRIERDNVETCPYCDRKAMEKEKTASELLEEEEG